MEQDFQTQAFTALANKMRREIIFLLANGRKSVDDLSILLGVSIEAIEPHLQMLEQLGICKTTGSDEPLSAELIAKKKILYALDSSRNSIESTKFSTYDPLDELFAATA
jgi:predicted transcriptional regulator